MSKAKVVVNNDKLQYSLELLRALAHPLRLQILKFIDEHESINVNKIYSTLNLEQSITSQHLKILRSAGLVITEREGKFIHYRIDYPKVQRAAENIHLFVQH
ncbi:MAG: helix-turn-helix transcriptional regulator [Saprospiraceae bacterium]|jgi:ArsR family transcriptional regulator|nr:helix-turn-helix transcriptional regulator [Saprospiraceae bacterium]HRD80737.1 metalloregulator ArsR/SmtB family transcription factor [Saprospiraceae bacterium]HRF42096.1 metalloregulator ArsR/SmtB family transcription factor [Saprospiraceae bacterium]HRJ15432.1 metalloregulator ArsR/SmtB family transcription factor [Saprospiraceae bacterium]HRK80023.1 metalloregulator ArsR/SmtB family transcription factor [Saprospiraceae bacterium]